MSYPAVVDSMPNLKFMKSDLKQTTEVRFRKLPKPTPLGKYLKGALIGRGLQKRISHPFD